MGEKTKIEIERECFFFMNGGKWREEERKSVTENEGKENIIQMGGVEYSEIVYLMLWSAYVARLIPLVK